MRQTSKTALRAFTVAALAATAGCASILSDSQYPVTLNSSPSGAEFTVKNTKTGMDMMAGTTPATITLPASNGYFSKAEYNVQFSAPGRDSVSVPLSASIDGWFFGNILLGGPLGLLVIDPATGAMWKLDRNLMVSLGKSGVASDGNTLSIMTVDQVPAAARASMVPLD